MSQPHHHLRIRDLGYSPGRLPTGPQNSILDVPGVSVAQVTKIDGDKVQSGVTVILPRRPADVQIPCYAGMHTLNGNGEVTGSHQIKDWGYINTPIALTNSTSLGTVYQSIWNHTLSYAKAQKKPLQQMGRDYGTPVVGETADWWANDVYTSGLSESHVRQALGLAMNGGQSVVLEGQHGGGAGMTCHQFMGGTGTASRVVDGEKEEGGVGGSASETVEGKYTVGVLCQSNYGHKPDLHIGGVPIGRLLMKEDEEAATKKGEEVKKDEAGRDGGRVSDGSIVILIFTDAPLIPHQLTRLAQHATVGLSQVGSHGVARNFSGDIFLAISTAHLPLPPNGPATASKMPSLRSPEQLLPPSPQHAHPRIETHELHVTKNESMDALFRAVSEATEEAILNSLVGAREGRRTHTGEWVEGLPVERVRGLLESWVVRM